MPRIAIRHAHQLAYRRRLSLGVRMLGCLVMLAGAIVLAAALAELAKGTLSREARLMLALGPLLFASGATLFCGERGLLIDRETRTLTRWWRVVLPLRRTSDDISHYQAVVVCDGAGHALPRWQVCLRDAHGEHLELFELAAEDVAQFAARQIAAFLPLPLAQPPVAGAIGTAATVAVPIGMAPPDAPPAGRVWSDRRHFGLLPRGVGIVCLVLGFVLGVGMLNAGGLGHGRWFVLVAAAAPLCLLGLWLLRGGRRVLLDLDRQVVKIWRAWPLPPAIYELPAFYAVIVAPERLAAPDDGLPLHLVGLIGANQLRLEIVRGLPRDEAQIAATELSAIARLRLIDERLPAPG